MYICTTDSSPISFKIWFQNGPNPPKTPPNPPQILPKSTPNRSKGPLDDHVGPVLAKRWIFIGQKTARRRPKVAKRRPKVAKRRPEASQNRPKWSPGPSQTDFLGHLLAFIFLLHIRIDFSYIFFRFFSIF